MTVPTVVAVVVFALLLDVGTSGTTERPAAVEPAGTWNESNVGVATRQSSNWSGYVATGGTFTAVSGTWTVPASSAGPRFASVATWVGIGGVTSSDLIQIGTQETVSRSGRHVYSAWVEALPMASQTLPLTVAAGNVVTAAVALQSPGQWLVQLSDLTTDQSFRQTISYSSSRSSADWIVEAPSTNRDLVPLANFGAVQFSNASAMKNGVTGSLAAVGAIPVQMVDGAGDALATPSGLSANGAGFSVTRAMVPSIQLPVPPSILFPIPGAANYRQPRDIRSESVRYS
jgi:hypothetical protein